MTKAASDALLTALIVAVDAAAAAVEVTMAEKHQLPLPAPTATPVQKADGTEATCPCPRCLEDIPGMKESVLKSSADLTTREDKPLSACCYLLAKNRIGKERGRKRENIREKEEKGRHR